MNDNEFFLYDHRGLVVRTANRMIVLACAKQILRGIAICSWYSHESGGGTFFDFDSFASAFK